MTETRTPLWQLNGISKAYPGVQANSDISISLYPGEIHGLLGENGCGKSTLIKILSGVIQPDSGQILCRGETLRLLSPTTAREHGVATVFQEFSLVPTLSVAENIYIGRYPRRGGLIDWSAVRQGAADVLSSLDIEIAPQRLVAELSVAEQQLVEIAKAISINATLMILDEPTTALGKHEIDVLHGLLRRMKSRGVAILYISHRLDEVIDLVDHATILKDGTVVSNADETRLEIDTIVSGMIGEDVGEHYPKQHNASDQLLFEARNVASSAGVNNLNFSVRSGEVFGLGGVIGSGRTEIARALFGVDPLLKGEISVEGKVCRLQSTSDAIAAGLALVPENRKFDGLFANFFGGPNITSAALGNIQNKLLLSNKLEQGVCEQYIRDLEISPHAAGKFVNLLSGGNQQKIVIARWLFADSQVLILDEPTQGIDIGAKIAVYRLINELTEKGCAVILISSDHNELIAMSDRIGIVRDATIIEIRDAAEVSHANLVQASAHVEAQADLAAA